MALKIPLRQKQLKNSRFLIKNRLQPVSCIQLT